MPAVDNPGSAEFGQTFWRRRTEVARSLPEISADGVDDQAFRLLADNIPTLCWIANGDGYIVWYNRRWHDYCGTTPAQMEGWGWTAVHDPALLPSVMERWTASIASGEPFEMTFPLRGADGVFRPFLTRIQPVRDASGKVARWFGTNTEISSQLDAEAALRESESRSRFALEAGRLGAWTLDLRTEELVTSPTCRTNFGRHADAPFSYAELRASVHPDDQPRMAAAVQDSIAGGTDYDIEYRVITPAGETRWIHIRARPSYAADGTPLSMTGVSADVTARRQAERRREEIEERYRLAARATNDAIWDWRMADGHVTWNEAVGTLFGHPERETSADWWIDHIHPDDRDRVDADIHQVINGGSASWSDEYRFRRADGSYADVLDRGTVLRDADGRAVRMIGAMLDLSGHRAAQAQLRESEAKFHAIANSIDQMVWSTRPDGFHDYYNDRWYEYTGVPAGSTDGEAWNGMFHPDDQDRAWARWRHSLETGEPYHIEYRLRHRSGEYRWVIGRAQAVHSAEGAIQRWYGTCTDVHDLKTAENRLAQLAAELRTLNDQLEQRVAERTAELEQAHEALRQSQKMEAVGQLTGGIAHDFNNMLAVVIGSLDLLGRRIGTADARAKRYVDAATDGARRAANLTQRLLAFSRQQPLKPETVDANKLVSGMSDLLRHSLGGDVQLETVLAGGLWRTHADPNQLENVILNLAVNARDAMPEGGRVTIETANCHLDARYTAAHPYVTPGQYVLVAVTDTGGGMSPEIIAKAFDPFFTTKEVGKGTGLGLSQVYGFVKQSGGHVKIYSEPGQGTTVKVYLPRRLGEGGEAEPAPEPEEVPLGETQEVVLVVEDEPAVRQFSTDALAELGYRVLEADGAAAALRLLDAHPGIALLFTDVVMPEVNGRKLADEALRRRPDLKVLFTTG